MKQSDNDVVMINFRVTRKMRDLLRAEAIRRRQPLKTVFINLASAWLRMKNG